jgi:hypothetical protein
MSSRLPSLDVASMEHCTNPGGKPAGIAPDIANETGSKCRCFDKESKFMSTFSLSFIKIPRGIEYSKVFPTVAFS